MQEGRGYTADGENRKEKCSMGVIVNSFTHGNKVTSSTLWLCSDPGMSLNLHGFFFFFFPFNSLAVKDEACFETRQKQKHKSMPKCF